PSCACRWSGIRRHKRNDSNAGSYRGFCLVCLCHCPARQKGGRCYISSSQICLYRNACARDKHCHPSEIEGAPWNHLESLDRIFGQDLSTAVAAATSAQDDEETRAGSTFTRRPPRSKRTFPSTKAKIV